MARYTIGGTTSFTSWVTTAPGGLQPLLYYCGEYQRNSTGSRRFHNTTIKYKSRHQFRDVQRVNSYKSQDTAPVALTAGPDPRLVMLLKKSADSCKAFFRRNADRSQQFQCFLGGNCKINLLCRKYCKMCRLKKCFDIGMRSELILSEEQKESRRMKIQEKKRQKKEIIDELTKLVDSTLNSGSPAEDGTSSGSDGGHSSPPMDLLNTYSNDSQSSESADHNVVQKYFRDRDTTGIAYDTYRSAAELEFAVLPIQRPLNGSATFNELEAHRLTELFEAIKTLHNRRPVGASVAADYAEALNALRVKCDYEIRRIVKMSKQLSAFCKLCEEDKIHLLKYSAIEIFSLRMVTDFDPESYNWNAITNNEISTLVYLELLKEGKRNYYKNYKDFLDKLLPEWNSDTIIIDLLTAIILFDSSRPKLIHRESVKLQQQIYMYLLQRYLRLRYQSDCVSETKFLRLLNSLHDLHIVNDKIAQNWIEGDPQRTFKCQFGDNCKIDVLRRRFCKKCRLKKCFEVGMKKEWILNEDERKVRKIKIEENRKKRKNSEFAASVVSDSSQSSDTNSSAATAATATTSSATALDILKTIPADDERLNKEISEIEDYIRNREILEVSDSVFYKAVEFEFSLINSIVRPFELNNKFTDIEANRMAELVNATKRMSAPLPPEYVSDYQRSVIDGFKHNRTPTSVADVTKLAAIQLENTAIRTVHMTKELSAFGILCESDKLALIKHGSVDICAIRSVLFFNFQYEYWTFVLDHENSVILNLDLLRQYNMNTFTNHKNFFVKIESIWDSDPVIIDLLTAILLFNPERPKLVHKELVKLQQHIYMYLLQRYLISKYRSECEAKSRFLKLLNCLQELPVLNDKVVHNWLSAEHPDVGQPLMNTVCQPNNLFL
ncbi:unnamed protein product [Medioppia subpectinata]|uniref:Uncharacterized protein n=1 Tax=Medioppia subpectinata TaxID=1979941 RepID=A0A7R9PU86_9ACAR|nr:unnamed protein product [Medioppia subpectinata]CAG2101273.1 unnamed protein product [Medioppia subpectinata]